MVVGFDSADDCAIKPLMRLAAKWGKRLFIGCIPFAATVDNVWSHFSQFGHVLDVYLSKNYHPIVQSFNEEWKEKLSQADVDIFRQIEIKFTLDDPELKVMKCGGCLIFEQDIEDLNQTMPRCSSNCNSCSIYQSKDEKMKLSDQKQGEDIRSVARAENKALSTEQ